MAAKSKKLKGKLSSEIPKSQLKDLSWDELKDSDVVSSEKESSFAWKILSLSQVRDLKLLTPIQLMDEFSSIFELEFWRRDWKQGAILDYYVTGFVWITQQGFDPRQISAFITLINKLLENIREGKSLHDLIMWLSDCFVGISDQTFQQPSSPDISNEQLNQSSTPSSPLECFKIEHAHMITEYLSNSIFQHYSLYEIMFADNQPDEIICKQYTIEVPPLTASVFPPPLDEALPWSVYERCLLTPPPTPLLVLTPASLDQPLTTERETSFLTEDALSKKEEDILANLTEEQIRIVVNRLAAQSIGELQDTYHKKLKDREELYINKINKLAKMN